MLQEESPVRRSLVFRVVERGIDVSYCLRIALFQTRGSGEIWRSGTISKCHIVVTACMFLLDV